MRNYFLRNSRKLLLLYGALSIVISALGISFLATHSRSIFDLLASSLASFTNGATTTIFFGASENLTLQIGGTTSIDIDIHTKIPINALGATISFPKDKMEVISISKEKSFFDLWTEDTSIAEDSGEIHFSGGTTMEGGIVGTGTVLTLTMRARTSGTAQLRFTNVQVYPSNGSGMEIETALKPLSYTIEEPETSSGVIAQSGASTNYTPIPLNYTPVPRPSADLNKDGKINLVDFSILTFKMFRPYDAVYDLNLNGSVGIDDLSILLSKM